MDAPTITSITVVLLVCYVIYKETWPAFVKWMDTKAEEVEKPKEIPLATIDKIETTAFKELTKPEPLTRRRMGLAEMRRKAELESMAPVTHQQKVTEKNTKALEGL